DQAQQEPDLLLAAVVAAPFPPDPLLGNLVAQPAASSREDAHVLRTQAGLFLQFAVHRLLGRLAALDTALRKLPRVLAHPLAPEDLIVLVDQDDANVGAVAVAIEHGFTPRYLKIRDHYIERAVR